jgi:transketolase
MAPEHVDGPTALVLTRQDVPTLDRSTASKLAPADGVQRGAYVLAESSLDRPSPDIILIGTGSEVHPCLEARDLLAAHGIGARVVSMPSMSVFDAQPESYRREVLPPDIPVVSVEAGVTHGWERYVGPHGASIGLDHFGASAPGKRLMQEFGFTGTNVAERVRELLRG